MPRMSVLLAILVAFALPGATAGESSELFQAIRNGDIAFVKAHLMKPEIEARDSRGATPLMHAAAFGDLETLKLLLDAGADVNAHNDFNATALLWAAREPEKARILIEHGANVNVQSKQGRTPLMVASLRRGGSAVVALMLAKGADVNLKDSRNSTALSLAASVGDAESVKLLLAAESNPNIANRMGASPINMASYGRSAEAVHLLMQKDVDVNNATTGSGLLRKDTARPLGPR